MDQGSPKPGFSRRRKLWLIGILCVLLIAMVVVLSSCIQISGLNLHSNATAGGDHIITVNVESLVDWPSPIRATVAIRIPAAWDVTSIGISGAMTGQATYSANMTNYFGTEWEATPVDAGHNGPKQGYKWWAGYSPSKAWTTGQTVTMTVHINTHGRGGTYLLDFVFGYTDAADPNNTANKGTWQSGALGSPPPGVLLDRQIILHCFTDVQPGHPFYTAIQGLGAMGLISGYGPDGGGFYEFRPANTVYRAQYAKFITGTFNAGGAPSYTVVEGMAPPVNFPDLGPDNPTDLYPHEYVWVAYIHGITKGYANGNFQPYIPISRAHVLTMTVRGAQGLSPPPLTVPPPGYVGLWGLDMLPEHAANASIAEYNGLLMNIPLASGNAGMPRQEVAQVMWNLYNKLVP